MLGANEDAVRGRWVFASIVVVCGGLFGMLCALSPSSESAEKAQAASLAGVGGVAAVVYQKPSSYLVPLRGIDVATWTQLERAAEAKEANRHVDDALAVYHQADAARKNVVADGGTVRDPIACGNAERMWRFVHEPGRWQSEEPRRATDVFNACGYWPR